MLVVGLTGSIGMGKSTTAAMFEAEGAPVYDSDAAVAALYGEGGAAAAPIEQAFPGSTENGVVDREVLRRIVLDDPDALRRLEAIVHPLLSAGRDAFFERARTACADIVVLDVPLLFETGADRGLDAVVVVSAPETVQRARVLERPHMTTERLAAILARQTPDAEKRARADYVVDTSRGLEAAREQVRDIMAALRTPPPPGAA